uniref:DUF1922 domain-containing protein n=1 Tax=uncultured marine group II/III euryarchaeote KM3_27_D02 TaxID=1456428 RepID=A0A075H2J4_9EURY|nr:hypothetical protein [uncultured marine group II/III euryarchaeote KM3_27_D02]
MSDESQFLVFRCPECERCFGKLSAAASGRCPACGSAANHKVIDRAKDDDDLQRRVALANVPSELRKELGAKIDKMPAYDSGKQDSVSAVKLRSLLLASRDEENRLSVTTLQVALAKEGIEEPTAEELISMAEFEGVLIRHSEGEWLYLE